MKKKVLALTLIVILLMTLATPVFAYKPDPNDPYPDKCPPWPPWWFKKADLLDKVNDLKTNIKVRELVNDYSFATIVTLDVKADLKVTITDQFGKRVTEGVAVTNLGNGSYLVASDKAAGVTLSFVERDGKSNVTVATVSIQ
jgi:hypothetical protein